MSDEATQRAYARISSAVAQLPESVVLHILSYLPAAEQAWAARRVNKAAHQRFFSVVAIPLNSPDLPSEVLMEFYQQHAATDVDKQERLIAARAQCNDLAGVQLLRSKGCSWDCRLCYESARRRHMDMLKWGVSHGCPGASWAAGAAASTGQLDFLQWLCQHASLSDGSTLITSSLCQAAAAGGQLAVLQWLRSQDPPCPWDEYATFLAAAHGDVSILQWMRSQDPPCPWDECAIGEAVYQGHLTVVQWCRAQDPSLPWCEFTCSSAAQGGRIEVLEWLRSQEPPCPWNANACEQAATAGQLAALQWLRSQDPPCPWHEGVCNGAAETGQLAVLQWARAQDPPCPWDETVCDVAAQYGNLEILQWARQQEPPCPWDPSTVCFEAAGHGQLAVLQWAVEHRQEQLRPWEVERCVQLALKNDHQKVVQKVLQWLQEQQQQQ